jgi:predicted Rossmann fold flavoprotein
VTVREYRFAFCSGISIRGARITLLRGGKKIMVTSGDVLFTHHGLSGPGILDLSRYIEPEDTISLSLFPFELHKDSGLGLTEGLAKNAGKPLKMYLKTCGIPERLLATAVGNAGIPLNSPCSSVDKKTRFRLEACLVEQPFVVERVNGFDQAMVTKGGISLCEVKPDTLESKVVPSLFFAGEVLDIDGDTGGYNLQFAFSSGRLVGNKV